MRTTFKPYEQEIWEGFFLEQVEQSGHGIPMFQGLKYQRGSGLGSIFGGLLRSILPVFKTVGKVAGREALSTGLHVASDALGGRNVGESLEEHARAGAANLLD